MVSERNAFPVGLRAAINSTKSVEVRIAGMTTIQMVKQKGQCNGDEIHAKIATIRHRISDLSQLGLVTEWHSCVIYFLVVCFQECNKSLLNNDIKEYNNNYFEC